MNHLVSAFICVQRGFADAQALTNTVTGLTNGTLDDSAVSVSQRHGILDFPSPEQRQENIASVTNLSKADLLKRAAESPGDLTQPEIHLLRFRYWLDVTEVEKYEEFRARNALRSESERNYLGIWRDAEKQLKRIRSSLYDANEEQALLNSSEKEEAERSVAASIKRNRQRAQETPRKVQPWIGRLWEEDQGKKPWGFATFCDPDLDESRVEEFGSRKDAAIWWAEDAVGCPNALRMKWRIQYLDWPCELAEDEDHKQAASDEKTEEDDEAATEQKQEGPEISETDLSRLRERFCALRNRAPPENPITGGVYWLLDGLLRNTFLLETQSSVESVLSSPTGSVDDMWVWAIDPDFSASSQSGTTEYKGYLRVRVQQLVNNFFEARRFHEDQYSMKQLWTAAQLSKNQAFTSVDEQKARLWTISRDRGSVLQPS